MGSEPTEPTLRIKKVSAPAHPIIDHPLTLASYKCLLSGTFNLSTLGAVVANPPQALNPQNLVMLFLTALTLAYGVVALTFFLPQLHHPRRSHPRFKSLFNNILFEYVSSPTSNLTLNNRKSTTSPTLTFCLPLNTGRAATASDSKNPWSTASNSKNPWSNTSDSKIHASTSLILPLHAPSSLDLVFVLFSCINYWKVLKFVRFLCIFV